MISGIFFSFSVLDKQQIYLIADEQKACDRDKTIGKIENVERDEKKLNEIDNETSEYPVDHVSDPAGGDEYEAKQVEPVLYPAGEQNVKQRSHEDRRYDDKHRPAVAEHAHHRSCVFGIVQAEEARYHRDG